MTQRPLFQGDSREDPYERATQRAATAHAILVDLVALDVEHCTRDDIRALVARARTALQ